MRLLIVTILIIITGCARSQPYFGGLVTGGGSTPPPDTPNTTERILIFDDFDGSSISADWDVRRPDKQTITVTGGIASFTANGDIVPGQVGYSYTREKSYMLKKLYTGYGLSMIRNYEISMRYRVDAVNDSSGIVGLGAVSPWNNYYPDSWGVMDYRKAVDTLEVVGVDDTVHHPRPFGWEVNKVGTVSVNDWITQRLRVIEDTAYSIFKNETTGDSAVVKLAYPFNAAGQYPLRPTYFNFGFETMYKTRITVDYFKVTTTELPNPHICFIGDSKTVGYSAGSTTLNWGYQLRANTDSLIQVWAGAGITAEEALLCLKEYRNNPADYVILDLGTNGGSFVNYQKLVDSLTANGSTVYKILQPNGGNPATSGTWNYQIAQTYPATYIDTWTTGWNTMSVGNGEMTDAVHPSNTGSIKIANIIKADKPALFPL